MLGVLGADRLSDPFDAFWPIALLAGAGVGYVVLRWFAKRDHLYAWYLMKDYAFSSSLRGAYPAEQETRMAEFADRIAAVLETDVDEVLVVGHSSGAYLAVSILADLIREGRVPGHWAGLIIDDTRACGPDGQLPARGHTAAC